MKGLIKTVGPCTLTCDADHFGVLVRSIIGQQISTKAAMSISSRLKAVVGRRGIKPAVLLDLDDDTLRGVGLSANKLKSIRDLASKCASGEVPIKKLAAMPDEEVIETLLPVRGIGRWTAEMFLMFSLGRRDVLPVADYGLRAGVMRQYGLPELATKAQLEDIGEPWRPFRSIATWYIWRTLGPVPQSEAAV
jgi:DNA-3-methyladenine glycosylase II